MSLKDIGDITLHSVPQAAFCFMAGAMVALGAAMIQEAPSLYDSWTGVILCLCGLAAFVGAMLYWLGRERRQHGYDWGKAQSFLEWIVPVAVGPCSFFVGLYVGVSI